MKKKFLIGTIIPTIAAISVIGSGFSLWIFSDSNEASTSNSINTSITSVVESANVIGYNSGYNGVTTTLNFIPPSQQINDGYSNQNGYNGIYISNNSGYYDDTLGRISGKKERVVGSYYIPSTSTYSKFLKATTANQYADGVSKIKEKYGNDTSSIYSMTTPESYIKGETDLVFTTTIRVPKCIGQYINLGYKLNAAQDIHDTGFSNVEYTDDASIYTIVEKYSELEPEATNDYEFKIVNPEYADYATSSSGKTDQVRMGYFFFDSRNLRVSYYNDVDGINCDDNETLKNWHKNAPSTLDEYKEMRESILNDDGTFKSISISYKAEVILLDD